MGVIIEQLTDEHRASFDSYVDKWTAIGRSTEPMDRDRAAAALADAYKAADLDPPAEIHYALSPLAGVKLRNEILASHGVTETPAWHSNVVYGCHDVAWMAFYDWFGDHGLAEQVAPLRGMMELSKSAGWCWLYRGFAVVTDRPSSIQDGLIGERRRRCHCAEKRPSVEYRDGWKLWHWHGLAVPEWVVMDPTPERIWAERNDEIRRCAIESLGLDRWVEEAGLELIAADPDPHVGTLYDCPDIYEEPVKVLVVRNGTPDVDGTWPTYGRTVPATVRSPHEAQAWLAGVPAEAYDLARRT